MNQIEFDGRLREIRRRCEKATPGPWDDKEELAIRGGEPRREIVWCYPPDLERWEEAATELADSEFIAAARNDVPWLLEQVDRLRGEVEEWAKMNNSVSAACIQARKEAREFEERLKRIRHLG